MVNQKKRLITNIIGTIRVLTSIIICSVSVQHNNSLYLSKYLQYNIVSYTITNIVFVF